MDRINPNLVFYLKKIVDAYYPTGNEKPVNTIQAISQTSADIEKFSDEEFSDILISCFIPDLYSDMGKREKLYTKMAELLVGEWWRRIGGTYNLPTMRSGTEDVELIYKNKSVVCDAKIFRLGRSQKAPNPKDFLKLADLRVWIDNLNNSYLKQSKEHNVIGGMITYSSLHEWRKNSHVYRFCTDHQTSVLMLPYEKLALLLKYKSSFSIDDFLNIWRYVDNKVITCDSKESYWKYVDTFLKNLINVDETTYCNEIQFYHERIEDAVSEYKKLIEKNIEEVTKQIKDQINSINDIETLKDIAYKKIEEDANKVAYEYLERIEKFRNYD